MLLGAVDLDDVRMTHTRKPARLLEQSIVRVLGAGLRPRMIALVVQQLERDFPVQRGVPRAVDLARRALADAIEERQTSPVRTTGARVERLVGRRRWRRE